MKSVVLQDLTNLPTETFTELGGLIQVTSKNGGSKTQFAVSCLENFLTNSRSGYFLFSSDEGVLYPPTLSHSSLSLSKFLLVKTQEPNEVWRVGLEALQTGLFEWIVLRPSKCCQVPQLRKMQILSEKSKTKIFILCQEKLPHWMLKFSLEVTDGNKKADSLFSEQKTFNSLRGSLSLVNSQGSGT